MKVLQINVVYKYGSTGKIVAAIHDYLLSSGDDSIVLYGRGYNYKELFTYKICKEVYAKFNNLLSRFSGIEYGGCYYTTNKIEKIIEKEKPTIVHLHCLNGYFVNIYKLLNWLKENRIKTVLTLHAEFMYTGGCDHAMDCYQWRREEHCRNCKSWREFTKSIFINRVPKMWKDLHNAYEGFENDLYVTSVSPWLKERAESSDLLKTFRHYLVMNGIDTSIFYNHQNSSILQSNKFKNKKILLHVTPEFSKEKTHLKGGYYILEIAKKLEKIAPNVIVIVVGPVLGSCNTGGYNNIVFWGKEKNQMTLAQLYSVAALTLLTSKRETFSLVTAESLCCGTPVVGFKAGAPEKIALPGHSCFVDYGDVEELTKKIIEFLERGKSGEIEKIAKSTYSMDSMVRQYYEIYNEALSK